MPRLVRGIVLCGWMAACHAGAPQSGAPSLAGVTLGDTPAAVERVLGRPERRQESLGLVFWDYERRGLSLLWDDALVLRAVIVKKPTVAAIEGVAVGDSATVLPARWGEPARTRQEGRFLDFLRPTWIQTAEVHGGRIVEITVLAKETTH